MSDEKVEKTETEKVKKKPSKGRLSEHEKAYFMANAHKLTAEELAEKTGRGVNTVREFLKQNYTGHSAEETQASMKVVIKEELRESPQWKRLKKEFNPDEVKDFEYHYIEMRAQFKDDVTPAEDMQIFEFIKLELLKSRNLIERRQAREDIARLTEQVEESARFLDVNDADAKRAHLDLEKTLASCKTAEGFKINEYNKLQDMQKDLSKNLKATRDQRFKEADSGKETFMGLVKKLQEEDSKEGKEAELFRLAAEKEFRRLGSPHKFIDGMIDQPILSEDTVMEEEEDE